MRRTSSDMRALRQNVHFNATHYSARPCELTSAEKPMSSDAWQTVLEKTHDAVREFARAELLALTRRAIHRLKRTKASGVYGEDYRHRSLWKEYWHEVQEGPMKHFTAHGMTLSMESCVNPIQST